MPTSKTATQTRSSAYENGSVVAPAKAGELHKEQSFYVPCTRVNTGIVIVNWNSWQETIEALEAIFKLKRFNGPVVVCDNASTDDSIRNITLWASGSLCALPENNAPEIYSLIVPPVKKIFQYRSVGEEEFSRLHDSEVIRKVRLWIVKAKENRGFAAGNNIGLRFLRRMGSVKWFWLLNNDTVPSPYAYIRMMEWLPATREPVIAGGALLEYWSPKEVQACGAIFNPYLLSARNNLQGASISELKEKGEIIPVSYPVGASIIVNRGFLNRVGLMCEDYFLYYEEIDWVMRHSWPSKAFVVTSSLVYHKGGKTTGAGNNYRERSLAADYFFIRSRILFAKKLGILTYAGVTAVTFVAILRRLFRFKRNGVKIALIAAVDGFAAKKRDNFP